MAGLTTYHDDSGHDSALLPNSAQTAHATGAGAGWRRVASGLWMGSRRGRMACGVVAAACVWLAGCGGGGGDGSGGGDANSQGVVEPPSTGATLASTSAEAQSATPAALSAAESTGARVAELRGIPFFGIGSVFGQSAADSDTKTIQSTAIPEMRPLTVESGSCLEAGFNSGCSGSLSVDYTATLNTATNVITAHSGNYIDFSISSVSGTYYGLRLSLDGRIRIDFLSDFTFNPSSPSLGGMDALLRLENFTASISGVGSIGRTTATGRFTADNQGTITYTIAGVRYGRLTGVRFTNPGTFVIGGGVVRVAYWNDSSKYVEYTFQNYSFVNGRPTVGSKVTVAGATGGATVSVTSTSSTTVVYTVNMTSGLKYTVTATYPPSGSPTYTVVAS